MKIVFKDSIFDVLSKRISDAHRANKKIDYILVTEEEYADMRADRYFMHHMDYRVNYGAPGDIGSMNATFKTIQLKEPDYPHRGARSPYMCFQSSIVFQGVDIYVVPKRFM